MFGDLAFRKILRKWIFFFQQVLHERINTLDPVFMNLPGLIGLQCCILSRSVAKGLDHLFGSCVF